MPEIKITTEEKQEEKKVTTDDIKETLKAADEYQKLKEENDKLEAEIIRAEELKNRRALGGKSYAGQYRQEKSPQELADEEAKKILSIFR